MRFLRAEKYGFCLGERIADHEAEALEPTRTRSLEAIDWSGYAKLEVLYQTRDSKDCVEDAVLDWPTAVAGQHRKQERGGP